MSPKRLKTQHPPNPAVGVSNCEDIMLNILTRLPVKSIIRFKSVCKPWHRLLSTAEFRKMHQVKFSNDPKNQSLLVHRINRNASNTISVINIESNEKKATILDNPFNYERIKFEIVGCCKGLVCISRHEAIVLWNPAMNLFKKVGPKCDREKKRVASLGFGYDEEADDFKVVRIVHLVDMMNRREMKQFNWVEVYSVKSGCWTVFESNLQFTELWTLCDAIVNGNPYWVVKVDEKKVLVCFDVKKLIFKIVSLSTLDFDEASAEVEFFDCDGSIGAHVVTWENGGLRVSHVDVWVFDDGEQIWRRNQRVGPIEEKVDRVLRCLGDGKVLAKRPKGQLILFDPAETRCVEGLFNVAREGQEFEIYGYAQGLTHIEGMKKVTLRKRRHY